MSRSECRIELRAVSITVCSPFSFPLNPDFGGWPVIPKSVPPEVEGANCKLPILSEAEKGLKMQLQG
jgi:hypothetical protein